MPGFRSRRVQTLSLLAAAVSATLSVFVLWNWLYHGNFFGGGYALYGARRAIATLNPLDVAATYLHTSLLFAPVLVLLALGGALQAGREGLRLFALPLVLLLLHVTLFSLYTTPTAIEPARRLAVVWLVFAYAAGRSFDAPAAQPARGVFAGGALDAERAVLVSVDRGRVLSLVQRPRRALELGAADPVDHLVARGPPVLAQPRAGRVAVRGGRHRGAPGEPGRSWLRRAERLAGALEVQQRVLAPQPAAVAAELAALVDHAVAGDHDRDPVHAVGAAHGARGLGRAHRARQVLVRARLAVRDLQELGPHLLLRTACPALRAAA
jgi:hypothetical protein